LDGLREDAELLARTILERQKKEVPADAMPDILSLAERFAQADVAMWGTARDMAERVPVEEFLYRRPEIVELFDRRRDTLVADAAKLVGTFTISDGDGNVLVEAENKMSTACVNDVITINPTVSVDGSEPVKLGPALKVHVCEPEKKPHAVFDDIEFDDALIAKMMANIAANGMTVQDLAG
jgi:hypothetical protein